jgi:signal transduction histidine kinase
MRQVLLNLFINALDSMPGGGTLGIEMKEEIALPRANGVSENGSDLTRWVTVRVTDSGCGLPTDLADRIFEPFVTTKETGIGLGLPICKRIIEAHMGEISALNRPEGGAEFTVRLPLPLNNGQLHLASERAVSHFQVELQPI